MQSHATRYKRHIVPVLSLSVDFYVRVFVRIYTYVYGVLLTLVRDPLHYVMVCTLSVFLLFHLLKSRSSTTDRIRVIGITASVSSQRNILTLCIWIYLETNLVPQKASSLHNMLESQLDFNVSCHRSGSHSSPIAV